MNAFSTPQRTVTFASLVLVCVLLGSGPTFGQISSGPTLTWTSASFKHAVGDADISHVTEILHYDHGIGSLSGSSATRAILAAYYGKRGGAKLSISTDGGLSWRTQAVPGLSQVRTMVTLRDGSVLLGGSTSGRYSPLVRLRHIRTDWSETEWLSCGIRRGGVTLPTRTATTVWDIQLNSRGDAFISAGAEENDPAMLNAVVFRTTDRCETLVPAAALPTQSVLALAIDPWSRLYAATADTTEHDDPKVAGQTRVFYSDDDGISWAETGRPLGAAKVYHLMVKADGTMLAGTGIRGQLFASFDRGASWVVGSPIPQVIRIAGDEKGTELKGDVTRIYRILELERGWILAGTGNDFGDLWLSPNNGITWFRSTPESSDISNVSWTVTKAADGTIWVGKGSEFGAVYKATFIPPVWLVR